MTAYIAPSLQTLTDGPGPLTETEAGRFLVWDGRKVDTAALSFRGGSGGVGGTSTIAGATDFIGTPGAGTDGHAIAWDDGAHAFTLATFEAAGAAAAAVLAHVGASDPHSQYFLAAGVSGFGASLIDDADAAAGRATLGLGTMAVATEADYLLLNGRSGGQTAIGGTAASETLRLQSTANATKGKILFGNSAYDEVNNRLGLGMAGPTEKLYVYDGAASSAIVIQTGSTAAGLYAGIDFYSDVVTANMKALNAASAGGARFNFFVSGGYLLLGTAGNEPTYLYTSALQRVTVAGNGYVAIGDQSPTALLDVNPSASGYSAFRIRPGAAVSSPNDGDLWYLAADRLKFRRSSTTETIASGVTGTGAAATAGASYTSVEQAMLQAVYDAARAFGMLA